MWIVLALITAFFTSFRDVLGRKTVKNVDPEIVAWGWMFFTLPFLYAFLFFEVVPPLGFSFWPYVAVVTVILTAASICFFRAIHVSEISISIPMLAFTPVFLLVTSPIMLGEFPRPAGLIGIFLIVFGAYVLNFNDHKKGYFVPFKSLLKEKGPRYMLAVAVLYSIGANIDKIVVANYSPIIYLSAVNTCVSIALFIFVLRKSKNISRQIKSVWPYLFLMGAATTIAFLCQMAAIKMAIVPYVIAIKRTSIIISTLFSFWLFKEKGFKERITGVILMIVGVFIISFFG